MPGPAVAAFAERAAAGAPEQPPVGGGPIGVQVPLAGRRPSDVAGGSGLSGRRPGAVFEAAGLAWRACARSRPEQTGAGIRVKRSAVPEPLVGRVQDVVWSATASAGRSAA